MGVASGEGATGLWTIPGAHLALSNDHMRHGVLPVAAPVHVIATAAVMMPILGIRQERDLNEPGPG
jgi:hypothetical protein